MKCDGGDGEKVRDNCTVDFTVETFHVNNIKQRNVFNEVNEILRSAGF